MRKLSSIIITILLLAVTMPLAVSSIGEIQKAVGVKETVVEVVGTGSMYPSLFWERSEGGPDDSSKMAVEEYRTTPHMYRRYSGFSILGKQFFRRPLGYGDMVTFQSEKTKSILEKENQNSDSGFIKRIIGVPGDTIELRDGYVIKNGERIDEPYIYRPRSTYGESFLADCRVVAVPQGAYLVLGDNRKTSSDSRGELGLIAESDISFVLPYDEQEIYHSLWRDTSRDKELEGTPTLNAKEFYTLVNDSRKSHQITALKENGGLVRSSTIRGNKYLSGDTEYGMKQSLADAGYSNILTGEFISPGHFTAEELIQNLLYFEKTAKQVLDRQYQEIGISVVTKEVNSCPTQVIVGHLGGYVPAEYDEGTVRSWADLVDNLSRVIPSWQAARGYEGINQDKLSELLTIFERRLALAREIMTAMQGKKWLTSDQQKRIENDKAEADRATTLSKELNGE